MSNRRDCCCCDDDYERIMIEDMVLSDGRRAERHASYDENGDEIIEIFAEEKRPVKLEKRIKRRHKDIVAEEVIETVQNGEVSHREVRSLEPRVPLQVVERIGLADHATHIDGEYATKKDVADAVLTGLSAMLEKEPIIQEKIVERVVEKPVPQHPEPLFTAQSQVAKNVEDKKQGDNLINMIMLGIIVVQVVFFGYMYFAM